jgi:hypothetical protein
MPYANDGGEPSVAELTSGLIVQGLVRADQLVVSEVRVIVAELRPRQNPALPRGNPGSAPRVVHRRDRAPPSAAVGAAEGHGGT